MIDLTDDSMLEMAKSMRLQPVSSSNLGAVGHDGNQTLVVQFVRNGAKYAYFGVSPALYQELLGAASKGRFFRARIVNGPYEASALG